MAGRKAEIATDAEIGAAMTRVRSEGDDSPLAVAVKYISGYDIYIVALSDGSRLVLQRERLQGLQNATRRQLSKVEILGLGSGLHWQELDVDLYVPALKKGVFGDSHWMKEMGRLGGSKTSEAKAQASRLNGAKGGRPGKVNSGRPALAAAAKKSRKTDPLLPAG